MKRKVIFVRVIVIISLILIICMTAFAIDYARVKKGKLPIFCVETVHVADGGTTIYMGLGYKVIKYNIRKYSDGIVYTGIFIGPWSMEYKDYNEMNLNN